MKLAPFTIQVIEESIGPDWNTEANPEPEYVDDSLIEPADLRDALRALAWQCWDHIDERGDGTVILYPADGDTDYRTGVETRTTLIIKARRPEWAERLIACYCS